MNRVSHLKRGFVTAAFCLAVYLPVQAYVQPAQARQSESDRSRGSGQETKKVYSSDAVLKMPVQNKQGEDLGRIDDLVISASDGTIRYVVLSYGGLFGFADKLFAVPWQALKLMKTEQREYYFLLDEPADELGSAPGFNKDDWPDFADAKVTGVIKAHYADYRARRGHAERGQQQEAGERETTAALSADEQADDAAQEAELNYEAALRVSKTTAVQIQNNSGDEKPPSKAEVEDLLIDLQDARISYGNLKLDGVGALNGEPVLVAWSAFSLVESDDQSFMAVPFDAVKKAAKSQRKQNN